jgi:hypothetical protein
MYILFNILSGMCTHVVQMWVTIPASGAGRLLWRQVLAVGCGADWEQEGCAGVWSLCRNPEGRIRCQRLPAQQLRPLMLLLWLLLAERDGQARYPQIQLHLQATSY